MQPCKHCGQEFEPNISKFEFCCTGCEAVHLLLSDGQFELINSVQKRAHNFNYLDNDTSKQQFCIDDKKTKIRFFVEGVQCSTCLWILESLPQWLPFIQSSRLQMGQDILTVEINSEGSFSQVAEFLWALGYRVRPIEKQSEADELFYQQQKDFLKRMGVAAFSAGNIMLFSIPIYSEMPDFMEKVFHWISAILFLPVLLYSCKPFYISLARFFQTKMVNIDIPIVVSVIIGSLLSFYNLLIENENVYFDSLAALVALILASRVFLRSVQKNSFTNKFLLSVLESEPLKVVKPDGSTEAAWPVDIKQGMEFTLNQGQVLPVESILVNESALFNPALISGETHFLHLKKGDVCVSGMRVVHGVVHLQAQVDYEQSTIYQYLKGIEESLSVRTEFSGRINIWAERFVKLILFLALGFFALYAFVDIDEAIKRVLAFVIMACPCSLAFAIPLLESLSLKKASAMGILLKDPNIFERILNVKNVFFDKTGTLTEGSLIFLEWTDGLLSDHDIRVAYSMEQGLWHPIARCFTHHYAGAEILKLDSLKEIPGQGVWAEVAGDEYSFQKPASTSLNLSAEFRKNGELLGIAHFQEQEREGVAELVSYLKANKYNLALVSGDNSRKVQALAEKYNIEAHSNLSPTEKEQFLSKNKQSLFVGDGFNDVGALAKSYVSVTVQGGLESCLKVSDVYLSDQSLSSLERLFKMSMSYKRGLKLLLGFSVSYNIAFGTLALLGHIGPLVAAIAMPISSFIVIMLALFSVNYIEIKNWFSNRWLNSSAKVAVINS